MSAHDLSDLPNLSLSKDPEISVEPPIRSAIIDGKSVVGINEEDEAFYRSFDKARRRRVRTKIDLRLLPVLSILYLFATLDRANIANAKIEGLKEDTGITDREYNIVLGVFFLPYFMLEVPSNLVLKSLQRPSLYLGSLVCAWGLVMTCHTFAKNFAGLISLRFFLGVTESGFFPAATYLCSSWYRPHELAFRLSLFMAVSAASGAFSGLLAAGIGQLGGVGGLTSWQWIFLIEGCVTMLMGLASFFLLVDTPSRSGSWLDEEEIRFLGIQRFVKDGGPGVDKERALWTDVKTVFTDWRYWAFGLFFHSIGACGYGLKFVVPTIIRGMGYSKKHSQLLSAIPYIFGIFSSLGVSLASDVLKSRAAFAAGGLVSIITGLGILSFLVCEANTNVAGVIAGMSLITCGVFPMAPTAGSWVSNNTRTSGARAVGLAFVMAIGSLGGLTGSFIYVESEAPYFPLGYRVSLCLAGLGMVIIVALVVSYWLENKKMDRLRAAASVPGALGSEGLTYYKYTL